MEQKSPSAETTNPLAKYKEAKELTDQQIADLLGLDRTSVLRFRTGERSPSLETAFKIAERTNGEIPVEAWRAA